MATLLQEVRVSQKIRKGILQIQDKQLPVSAPDGGWALGCRIDGGQAEFVSVPYADQGLNWIPYSVTDEQALFVGETQ